MRVDDLEIGVLKYIDNELGSKATGATKFLIYTGSFLASGYIKNLVNKHYKLLTELTIINENNEIDVDKLYEAFKNGIQKCGKFHYMGIIFDETDVDKLFNYIKGY